jgi:hypothetical protein
MTVCLLTVNAIFAQICDHLIIITIVCYICSPDYSLLLTRHIIIIYKNSVLKSSTMNSTRIQIDLVLIKKSVSLVREFHSAFIDIVEIIK